MTRALALDCCSRWRWPPSSLAGRDARRRRRSRRWRRCAAPVALHPDDPELSWALAEALEAAGDPARPIDADASATWRAGPSGRRDGWRALGRCAYRAGRADDAIAALTRAARAATRATPRRSSTWAWRASSAARREQAEQHFEFAAQSDPALAPEALLLSGISRLGARRRAAAGACGSSA